MNQVERMCTWCLLLSAESQNIYRNINIYSEAHAHRGTYTAFLDDIPNSYCNNLHNLHISAKDSPFTSTIG